LLALVPNLSAQAASRMRAPEQMEVLTAQGGD